MHLLRSALLLLPMCAENMPFLHAAAIMAIFYSIAVGSMFFGYSIALPAPLAFPIGFVVTAACLRINSAVCSTSVRVMRRLLI